MKIIGKNFIGDRLSALGNINYRTFDPSKNIENKTCFVEATLEELEDAVTLADIAFPIYRETSGSQRASFLMAIADEILNLGEDLIKIYCRETGLPKERAIAERGRTIFQLQLFAKTIETEDWRKNINETAMPERTPLPKPSLIKTRIPLGPIAVFGASNFPLAYSTAGGDTASALAVGCPVIVKSHPMHSGTGAIVSAAIIKATQKTGMPNGVFSNLNSKSHELSHALVEHSKIKAVGFTGSYSGGTALQKTVFNRKEPIPFFAEMGSINPIAILPGAIKEKNKEIAHKIADSIALGAGQFCTQPGLLLTLDEAYTDYYIEELVNALKSVDLQCMIHNDLKKNYLQQSDKINNLKETIPIQDHKDQLEDNLVHPKLSMINGEQFITNPQYQEEVFGPFSLVVKCKNIKELEQVIYHLKGQLTGTIFAQPADYKITGPLIDAFKSKVGRFLFNGVPTGVEVTEAMTHGGPYPASSDSRFTAVGPESIYRWVRPITYQNWPNELLKKLID
ncbi:MAG: aldehyde dehydrogenase (NADP(+)) [Bacteroidota bacterium]|nr:aldehyde dehydrogenase (NADP(+)) [Bacteroidota bacterium]